MASQRGRKLQKYIKRNADPKVSIRTGLNRIYLYINIYIELLSMSACKKDLFSKIKINEPRAPVQMGQ